MRPPRPTEKATVFDPSTLVVPLDQVERKAIESAMILCEGNGRVAARLLGISAHTIYTKLKQYREADAEENKALAATV